MLQYLGKEWANNHRKRIIGIHTFHLSPSRQHKSSAQRYDEHRQYCRHHWRYCFLKSVCWRGPQHGGPSRMYWSIILLRHYYKRIGDSYFFLVTEFCHRFLILVIVHEVRPSWSKFGVIPDSSLSEFQSEVGIHCKIQCINPPKGTLSMLNMK